MGTVQVELVHAENAVDADEAPRPCSSKDGAGGHGDPSCGGSGPDVREQSQSRGLPPRSVSTSVNVRGQVAAST